jgi:EmrB/QacA subfamily drug resistance transporter
MDATTSVPIPRRAWAVLAVTAGAAFVAFLDVTIVNIAFPAITETFDTTSLSDLSWVFNAYNVVFAALLVPAGRLADLVGRRRLFLLGLLIFAAASAGAGLAPTAWVLIGFRVVQAVGAAFIAPASLALLLPAFPAERRASAVALWGATAAVAAATGPVLGGFIVDEIGWRWVFYVNVPLVALVVLAGRRLLDEARDPDRGAIPDVIGTALLAFGVGAVALGIVKSAEWGWDGNRTLVALGSGVLLLVAFVIRSRRAAVPTLELGLFRLRSFATANVASLVFSAGFYALLLANVLFLTGHWGYSELKAGAAITPGPLMAAVASAASGRIIDRRGPRLVLLAGGLLFAVGTLLFALRLHDSPAYVTEFLPATILTGLGVGSSFAAMSAAAVTELPADRFATGSAVVTCMRQIGAVLGLAILIGHLAGGADIDAFRQTYVVIAVAGLGTAGISFALRRGRIVVPVESRVEPVGHVALVGAGGGAES